MGIVSQVEADWIETASGLSKKDEFSDRLFKLHTAISAAQASADRDSFVGPALARYAIEQIFQHYIEDDRVDIRPIVEEISGELKTLIATTNEANFEFFEALKAVLKRVYDLCAQTQIPSISTLVDVPTRSGSELRLRAWISKDSRANLPVSKGWYPFVPILEDSLLDPELGQSVVDAFAAQVRELADDADIHCLGFIEKTMGPVGAILLAPILTQAVGLPGFVFREGYWTPRNQLAGPFTPNKNQRVLLIYDLMVSGGGLRHAAQILDQNFGVQTSGAVVLMSYDKNVDPEIRYFAPATGGSESHGTIQVRPITRFVDVEPLVPNLRNRQSLSTFTTVRGRDTSSPTVSRSRVASTSNRGEATMSKPETKNSMETLIAIRFKNGDDVDRAIDLIYSDPVLSKMSFDSPDGYELHISQSAEPILKKHGLKFKSRLLEFA